MTQDSQRIEKLLAQVLLLGLKDASLGEKALHFSRAGFEPTEIAVLTGENAASVRQLLYKARKSKTSRKKRAR